MTSKRHAKRWWSPLFQKTPCTHENLVSHLETIDGCLIHVCDSCQDCEWKSPYLPGRMVQYYEAQYRK
jgi:hypothetical protein